MNFIEPYYGIISGILDFYTSTTLSTHCTALHVVEQLKIELIYASSFNIDAYLCKWVNNDAYLAYWLTVILVFADGLMHQLVTSVTVKHLWLEWETHFPQKLNLVPPVSRSIGSIQ